MEICSFIVRPLKEPPKRKGRLAQVDTHTYYCQHPKFVRQRTEDVCTFRGGPDDMHSKNPKCLFPGGPFDDCDARMLEGLIHLDAFYKRTNPPDIEAVRAVKELFDSLIEGNRPDPGKLKTLKGYLQQYNSDYEKNVVATIDDYLKPPAAVWTPE